MRKPVLFFFLLLLASVLHTATYSNRTKFLQLYYYGDYKKAHELITPAFIDPVVRQIWEERIHIYWTSSACDYLQRRTAGTRAMAMLRVGQIQTAEKHFGDDWLSFAGRSALASWRNDLHSARRWIADALSRQPHRSELLYAAGQMAPSNKQVLHYLTQFLQLGTTDYLKRVTAQQTIDFIRKTDGLELNTITLGSQPQTLESKFEPGRLVLKGRLNENTPVKLLVDTGAAGISLEDRNWEPKIKADLMMIGLGRAQHSKGVLGVFERFDCKDMSVRNAVAAISPTLKAQGVDGVAGTILFLNYAILLPLKSDSELVLFPGSSEEVLEQHKSRYSHRVTIPFYRVNKMIIVKGKIKQSDLDMDILLDTGAEQSILSSATARRHVLVDYQKTRTDRRSRLRGLGGKIENVLHVRNVDIEIGSVRKSFNRMIASNLYAINEALELEIDLILGYDFLKGYTLLIDYRTNQLTFLK